MLVEATAEGFVGEAHIAVDAVEDGEFDEGIDEDEPRNPNGDEEGGVEGDGAPVEGEDIRPLHEGQTAGAEGFDEFGREVTAVARVEGAFQGLKFGCGALLTGGVVAIEVEKHLPSGVFLPRHFGVVGAQAFGVVEFAAGGAFDEVEMHVAVVVGEATLHGVGMKSDIIEEGEDPKAPLRTLAPARHDGLRHETNGNGHVDGDEPHIAGETVEDASPQRLLTGHAGELSVGGVIEIGPHEQADADEREVETAFAERHKDTGGGTEEDAQDGDDIGVDAEEIEEARPQQTDGAGEVDVDVFFGVGAFEGRLQVRVFSHGNRRVTLGAVAEKVERAVGDGLGGGLGAAAKGGPVVEIDEEEAPVGTNDGVAAVDGPTEVARGGVGGGFQVGQGEGMLGRRAVVLLESEFAEAVSACGIGVGEEGRAFHTVEFHQIAFEMRTHDEIVDAGGGKVGQGGAELIFVGDETHIVGCFGGAVAALEPEGETEGAHDERGGGHLVEKGRTATGFVEPTVEIGAAVAEQGGGAVPNRGAGGFCGGQCGLRGATSRHGEHQVGAGKGGG